MIFYNTSLDCVNQLAIVVLGTKEITHNPSTEWNIWSLVSMITFQKQQNSVNIVLNYLITIFFPFSTFTFSNGVPKQRNVLR